jgi:hypothetical protein
MEDLFLDWEQCIDEYCTLHFNPATDTEQLPNELHHTSNATYVEEALFISNVNDGDIFIEIPNG